MTQGRDKKGNQAWVTHYYISYSEDAYRWDWARDIYGVKKVGWLLCLSLQYRSPRNTWILLPVINIHPLAG